MFLGLLLLLDPGAKAPALPFEQPARVLLLNFWASWCGPCLEELPLLDALDQRLQTDAVGARVVTVNLDTRSRPAEAVVQRLELKLPVHYDPEGALVGTFDPAAMPATYLIMDGQVEQTWIGGLEVADLEGIEARMRVLAK